MLINFLTSFGRERRLNSISFLIRERSIVRRHVSLQTWALLNITAKVYLRLSIVVCFVTQGCSKTSESSIRFSGSKNKLKRIKAESNKNTGSKQFSNQITGEPRNCMRDREISINNIILQVKKQETDNNSSANLNLLRGAEEWRLSS